MHRVTASVTLGDHSTLGRVQTRYLLIASLVTALLILGASIVWFFMAYS